MLFKATRALTGFNNSIWVGPHGPGPPFPFTQGPSILACIMLSPGPSQPCPSMHSAGQDPDPWADFLAWPHTCHFITGHAWWSLGWVGSWLLPPNMILFCQLTFLGPASSPGDAKCSGLSVEPCCHLWACPAPLTWEQWDRVLTGKFLPCWPCVTHLMDQPHMTHSGGPILDCLMCSSAPKFHRRAVCSPVHYWHFRWRHQVAGGWWIGWHCLQKWPAHMGAESQVYSCSSDCSHKVITKKGRRWIH